MKVEIIGTNVKLHVDDDRDGSGYVFMAEADFSAAGSGMLGLAVYYSHAHFDDYAVYFDDDGDGYTSDLDCDESDALVNPGASEVVLNCRDDDCNPATQDNSENNGWQMECIDGIDGSSPDVSLATDATHNVHVVYASKYLDFLNYATNASGSWVIEIVDDTGTFDRDDNSLEIDSAGKAHIVYDVDAVLKYVTNISGSWIFETIDSSGNHELGGDSLALDPSGKAHVAYVDSSDNALKYASNISGTWVIETLINDVQVVSPSVMVDSTAYIHIAYYDDTNDLVKYLSNSSGSWITETVSDDPNPQELLDVVLPAVDFSLEFDSSGNLHISYTWLSWFGIGPRIITESSYNHATRVAGTWEVEKIDYCYVFSYEGPVFCSSIATSLDLSDNLHAVYTGEVYYLGVDRIFYLNSHTGYGSGNRRWINDGRVDSESLDIDTSGRGHLVYRVGGNVIYASTIFDFDGDGYNMYDDCDDNNSSINPSAVEICDGIDNNCDGAIDEGFDGDGDGYSSCSGDCDDTDAAVNPGAAEVPFNGKDDDCNPSTLDDDGDGDGYSVSEDCDDNDPAVNPGAAEIPFNGIDDDCNAATLDDDGDGDGYPIAEDCDDNNSAVNPGTAEVQKNCIDDDCNPVTPDSTLSGDWKLTCIDEDIVDYSYASIDTDSNAMAHVSYYASTKEDLMYATNASGSWSISMIESGSIMSGDILGRDASIKMDLNDKVHVSYYDDVNEDLKYATNASGSWVTSTIDSGGVVGKYSSIATDPSGNIHISYNDSTNQALKYATNAFGSWVISTITPIGSGESDNSIAIDSEGNAHISYFYYYPRYDLQYATNASGSWVISTIDSYGHVGGDNSISLDSNDRVHISYFDASNWDLKYATNASGSWVRSTIDELGSVGRDSAIAIDTDNAVHISFKDSTNSSLKYATNASGSWATSTVDSDGSVGDHPSIATDTLKGVHIIYQSWPDRKLFYAFKTNDTDDDGIMDDGDGSGAAGDNYCAGGNTQNCDDNCMDTSNPDQSDMEGDGIGDACDACQLTYPARNTDAAPADYSTLQSAYDNAGDGDTIQIQSVSFGEDLTFNLNKTVTISGGQDCGYSGTSGKTTINGSMTVSDGTVIIENVELY